MSVLLSAGGAAASEASLFLTVRQVRRTLEEAGNGGLPAVARGSVRAGSRPVAAVLLRRAGLRQGRGVRARQRRRAGPGPQPRGPRSGEDRVAVHPTT